MKVDISFDGMPKLQAEMERKKIGFISATKRATLSEVQSMMDDSVLQVPVETGTLRDSAFVEQDEEGNVTFGYGKGNAFNAKANESVQDYMVAVHERLDVNHPTGKAKFLEDPINEHLEELEESIAVRVRSFLGL